MADNQSWITYPQLMDRLHYLREEKRTGTLFCATEDNNSAVITLQCGAIVSLSFRTICGIAALAEIKTIIRCKVNFKERFLFRIDNDLPSDAEIFRLLNMERPLQTHGNSVFLLNTSSLKNVVKRETLALLGTTADKACEQHFTVSERLKTRNDLRQFLRAIAETLGKAHLAGKLIEKVLVTMGLEERAHRRAW